MTVTYEIIKSEISGNDILQRINDDGSVSFIPTDPANADYQAYLNKDTLVSNSSIPQAGN
jgi:hypothetical protein